MSQPFREPSSISVGALTAAAVEAAGHDDFGTDSHAPGLALLVDALARPNLRKGGRQMVVDEIVRYLANRLRVVAHHARHRDLAHTSVDAPVIILGLPRTGTTLLSHLMDRDPQWRCLLNWEAVFSVPPATNETLRTDPRCLELLEFQRAIVDHIDPPPPHWEWADTPTECTFLLAGDCRTVMWDSRLADAAHQEWIMSCDMRPAYEYHRSVLQVLGSHTSGTWCLKMPAHALFVDALLSVYPDARIIWMHRDPVAVTGSFLNLMSFSQQLTFGEPRLNPTATLDRLVEQVERPMDTLLGSDTPVHHVHYQRMIEDPVAEMDVLYEWLGVTLAEGVRTAMTSWLVADPLAVSRQSRYSLSDFGLTEAQVRSRFGDYLSMDFTAG